MVSLFGYKTFGYEKWFISTVLGYSIQFLPYAVKYSVPQKFKDIGLCLRGSTVAPLKWSDIANVNYHVAM